MVRAIAHLIVARDAGRGIGFKGKIPWPRLKKDMEIFHELTENSVVIMGRKTLESLPKLLEKRVHYVLSKTLTTKELLRKYGACIAAFSNLDDALLSAIAHYPNNKIFIIGGEEIYKLALEKNVVSVIYETEIQKTFQCDTRFPEIPHFEKVNSTNVITQDMPTGDPQNPVSQINYQINTYNLIQNRAELGYLNIISNILTNGIDVDANAERTGTGTLSQWGGELIFDLDRQFPLLTSKKCFLKGIFYELQWFISGGTNAKFLKDKGIKIWDGDLNREKLDSKGLTEFPDNELGTGYGFQWRHFGAPYDGSSLNTDYDGKGIDQLQNVIDSIQAKGVAEARRLIVCTWNPAQMETVALPPCHLLYQFRVLDGKLHCRMIMRSTDIALGLPFNIASYALLTYFIARICKLKLGTLVIQMGDCHIYKNHIDRICDQIERTPFPFPQLNIKKNLSSLQDVLNMEYSDLEIKNYTHHPAIKFDLNT